MKRPGASHGTKWPTSRNRYGPTWSGNTTAAMRSQSFEMTWSDGPNSNRVRSASLRAIIERPLRASASNTDS